MPPLPAIPFCAIDFGTSNSAIALPNAQGDMGLVAIEQDHRTMPTAVFYGTEDLAAHEAPRCHYGRAALKAYIEGHEGRLMRSMKSVLGSALMNQSTDIGEGRAVSFAEVVAGYLRHLRQLAQAQADGPLKRVVLGRPVFFVDDDPQRDRQAQEALEAAARAVGFEEVLFQFEPIAAALDYEQKIENEQWVLVADIGGGTSDFAVVRVGGSRAGQADRSQDILASHGVHVAGTDFDRHVSLASILPMTGYRALGPAPVCREVPSKVYHDLATWHLINTLYIAPRMAELRSMRSFYADPRLHARLMRVLEDRLGHALLAQAEQAKIDVAETGQAQIDLRAIESALRSELTEPQALQAMATDLEKIVQAGVDTVRQAGLRPEQVDAVYLTGGSTGLSALSQRIAAPFTSAAVVRGDRLASVAQGLGWHARNVWGGARHA